MRLAAGVGDMLKLVEDATMGRGPKIPVFQTGDTLRLQLRVPEGDKDRMQAFEGVCIGRRGGGSREMVVVRKLSFGIGVERIFPIHSPFVTKIEVVRKGKVRRAKLYYLREKTGKHARVKQMFQEEAAAEAAPVAAEAAPVAEAPAAAKEVKAEKKAKKEKK